eukprot:374150_1
MWFQITLTLFFIVNVVNCGIIGIYHELSDNLKIDLQILVQNGKYYVFDSALSNYGLDLSGEATQTLWDYICALQNDDTICSAFGSTSMSVEGTAAFAQLQMDKGFTFNGYWDTIPFTSIAFNKAISLEDTTYEITFKFKGIYKCTIGYRGGNDGADVWNAIRMLGVSSDKIIGISNAAGKIGLHDSTQHSFSFFFQVDDVLDSYVLQKGRMDGSSVYIYPASSWTGVQPPTMLALIEFIGSL